MIANRDIPFDVNVLRFCRCQDCQGMVPGLDAGTFHCHHYIGGTHVEFPSGRIVTDPPFDAWHYCIGYRGPRFSEEVWIWAKLPPASGMCTVPTDEDKHPHRGMSQNKHCCDPQRPLTSNQGHQHQRKKSERSITHKYESANGPWREMSDTLRQIEPHQIKCCLQRQPHEVLEHEKAPVLQGSIASHPRHNAADVSDEPFPHAGNLPSLMLMKHQSASIRTMAGDSSQPQGG